MIAFIVFGSVILIPIIVFLCGLPAILKAKRKRDKAREDWYNLLSELDDPEDVELWMMLESISRGR